MSNLTNYLYINILDKNFVVYPQNGENAVQNEYTTIIQ